MNNHPFGNEIEQSCADALWILNGFEADDRRVVARTVLRKLAEHAKWERSSDPETGSTSAVTWRWNLPTSRQEPL